MKDHFILLLLALTTFTCSAQKEGRKKLNPWSFEYRDSVNSTHKGTLYVPFDITTMDGKRITSESSKGKVTFFAFWFEGCSGCRGEIKELNALYDSLKTNPQFQFVAITFDPKEGLPEFMRGLL